MNWGATKQSLTGLTLGALAFALVMLGTRPPGPGLYGDSAGYIGAAESLVHSGTLRVPFAPYVSPDSTAPLAQWPPGFPIAIAAPMLAGLSSTTSARIVVAASAAVTAILVVWLLGITWGVLAVVVLGLTASVVAVHLDILSEPSFITVTVATLGLMVVRPQKPLAYGLTGALALLFRYLGIAVIGACGIWAFIWPAPSVSVRLRRAILGVLPGVYVYAIWFAIVSHGGAAVRHTHLDHFPVESIRQFVGATLAWLAPDTTEAVPRVLRVVMKAFLLFGVLYLLWHERRRSIVVAALLLAASCAALLLTAQLLQGNVEFSDRTFSPVHAMLDIAVVAAMGGLWHIPLRRDPTRYVRKSLTLGALFIWLSVASVATVDLVHKARTEGFYHAQIAITQAPLWRWVRDSARTRGAALYSNDVADVYFATHRPTRMLPWVVDADTARVLATALGRQPSLIIWENGYTLSVIFPELRAIAATPEQMEKFLPLRRVAVFPEGYVWAYGQ